MKQNPEPKPRAKQSTVNTYISVSHSLIAGTNDCLIRHKSKTEHS